MYTCAFHLMHWKILSWLRAHQLIRLPIGSKRQKRLTTWDLPICQYPTFFLCLCILINHKPSLICLSSTPLSWGTGVLCWTFPFSSMPDNTWNSADYFWRESSFHRGLLLWKKSLCFRMKWYFKNIYNLKSDHSVGLWKRQLSNYALIHPKSLGQILNIESPFHFP